MKQLLMALHARADKDDRADAPELFVRLDEWAENQRPTAKTTHAVATARLDTDNALEIDDDPAVDPTDGGTWVQAWVWVGDAE